jgi:hypothetical protein
MKNYTFEVYSPLLGKSYIHQRRFESESDFRLYCYALWSGNWRLITVS